MVLEPSLSKRRGRGAWGVSVSFYLWVRLALAMSLGMSVGQSVAHRPPPQPQPIVKRPSTLFVSSSTGYPCPGTKQACEPRFA
ncbi:hypothetical protein LZ30DRAFT_733270 [Colletotrichum cereale]|nr:hypothetical protein LZ30DRAFT_733270 [Colletotrichum cereale]